MEDNNNIDGVEADVIATPTSIEELEPKTKVKGKVTRLELYGAFVDIGVGTNALVHISKLDKDHVNRVSDVLTEGQEIEVWIDKVDPEQGQIMVTMVEPLDVDWTDLKTGQEYTGTVTRLENYGAFVNIGAEREGLVHISEISHNYVKNPSEVLSVGSEVQVQVLGFSRRKRRIDLSIKNLLEKPAGQTSGGGGGGGGRSAAQSPADFEYEEEYEEVPTAMEVALRRAMGDEAFDALEEERSKRGKKKSRKQRRDDQDELLDRTLQFQGDN
jgi:predicted RNA-binding protein with RPS1 domain